MLSVSCGPHSRWHFVVTECARAVMTSSHVAVVHIDYPQLFRHVALTTCTFVRMNVLVHVLIYHTEYYGVYEDTQRPVQANASTTAVHYSIS